MSEPIVTPVIPAVTPAVTTSTEDKTVPYSRFSEVISEKKALEAKLTEIQAKLELDNKAASEKKLKEEGDFTALTQKIQAEREVEKAKLNNMVTNTFLNSLASKNGLLKDEYIKLFNAELKVKDLEIENAKDVEEAFIKWRVENPTLFTALPAVPKTDSTPVQKINNTLDPSKLSFIEKVELGLKERAEKQNK